MRYHEDDEKHVMRGGIKRCKQKAKRRQWKKADATLGDAALVALGES